VLSSYNKWYVGLVLLLLASPALSLLGIFGFSYFPNEKIAILLVAISKYAWKRSFFQLRLLSLIVASVFIMLILFQFIAGVNEIQRAGINTVVVILSIPLYLSFFSHNPSLICRIIFTIGVIQLCVSLIQQYFTQNGFPEIFTYFNNYPPQKFYTYGHGEIGTWWYRTSGLFTESSSYSVFQWLSIFCALKISIQKRLLGKIVLFGLVLEVVLNSSLTGFVFAAGYLIFKYMFNPTTRVVRNLSFLTILFLISYVLLYSNDYYFNVDALFVKISKQFDFLYVEASTSPSRLRGAYDAIIYIFESNYYLHGIGLSWIKPTLDFYSLYLKGFGVIGFITLFAYILIIFMKAPLNFRIGVLLVMSINGHLSSAINILLISLVALFRKMKNS